MNEIDAQVLSGCGKVFEVCAEAFLNAPDQGVIDDLQRIAHALGDSRFDGIRPGADLTQRYYDRLFVPTSPHFVPLREESLLDAVESDDIVRWGSLTGKRLPHVLDCYERAAFDFKSLRGYDLAIAALNADSLACELAFLAHLCKMIELRATADPDASERIASQLSLFMRWHAEEFFRRAEWALARTEYDLYARVAQLASEAAAVVSEQIAALEA